MDKLKIKYHCCEYCKATISIRVAEIAKNAFKLLCRDCVMQEIGEYDEYPEMRWDRE